MPVRFVVRAFLYCRVAQLVEQTQQEVIPIEWSIKHQFLRRVRSAVRVRP